MAGVHILALFAAWHNSLVIGFKLGLSVAILLHAWYYARRWLRPRTALILQYDPNKGWQLAQAGETLRMIGLDRESLITPWLTILLYRDAEGRRRQLLLFADAFHDRDEHRRLRVMLKIYGRKLTI